MSIKQVIDILSGLPTTDTNHAINLVYDFFYADSALLKEFSSLLNFVSNNLKKCKNCFHFTVNDICDFCSDKSRDRRIVCILETSKDLETVERSGTYNGLYFLLHDRLDVAAELNVNVLNLEALFCMISTFSVEEIVIGLDFSISSELTASIIAKELKKASNILVTRIALGIPYGLRVAKANKQTIVKAFANRSSYSYID